MATGIGGGRRRMSCTRISARSHAGFAPIGRSTRPNCAPSGRLASAKPSILMGNPGSRYSSAWPARSINSSRQMRGERAMTNGEVIKLTIENNQAAQRWEAHLGQHLAVAEYRRRGDTLFFIHTKVPRELE